MWSIDEYVKNWCEVLTIMWNINVRIEGCLKNWCEGEDMIIFMISARKLDD